MSKNSVRGFMLGFVVVLAVGMVWSHMEDSRAQSGGEQYLLLTGNMNNQQYDYVYLVDTTAKKVAVYSFTRGSLGLVDVRNIKYDLRNLDYLQKRTGRSIVAVKKKLRN